ncbi:uroporphyrinogen-III C-methyltransferase [Thalassotalea sp. PLHSN55]|uniref:uroporphyrinogen-III C-methyltransferase n=1 Tax=Thalassotalea sp. PLHSN55 TaxID=3435888 RepID=UPI003F84BC74
MSDKKPSDKVTESAKVEDQQPETKGLSASINLTATDTHADKTNEKVTEKSASDANSSSAKKTSTASDTDKSSSAKSKNSPDNSAEQSPKTASPKPRTKETMSKTTPTAHAANKTVEKTAKQSLSKTAVVALLIALLALAAVAGLFYWNQQQQQAFQATLLNESQQINQASQQQLERLLSSQQQQMTAQLAEQKEQVLAQSSQRIAQLENSLARLSQNEPTDWLMHEAEYLVRIAGRTLWLEHDTRAAINLLQDADNRLSELNNPDLLPVRKLIHQDIEQLKLIPTLDVEEVVLSLNAMVSQVDSLVLSLKDQGIDGWKKQELELSDDISDWRENLSKSVDKFLSTFAVRVNQNVEQVEPLLTPQRHQNLRENIKLKLQLAQWAAVDEKSDLYLSALKDVQQWLNDYFDMNEAINQRFNESVVALEDKNISFNYSGNLTSLKALRDVSRNAKSPSFSSEPLSGEEEGAL